jgi:hypothetical protein
VSGGSIGFESSCTRFESSFFCLWRRIIHGMIAARPAKPAIPIPAPIPAWAAVDKPVGVAVTVASGAVSFVAGVAGVVVVGVDVAEVELGLVLVDVGAVV